ncbi:hypothetical protein Q5752_001674 [Cryptotrichosporon argae]
MSPAQTLPPSLDLTHHLTKRVRAQQPGAMKAMGKLLADKKDMLSLAGGMPHASLFPMQHATFTLPSLSALTGDVAAWQAGETETSKIHLKKTGPGTEGDPAGLLDLNDVLQYGLSNGYPVLLRQLSELNTLVHGRATADAAVYISLGNTDGVSKVWTLFVEPDVDTVLTESYTFGSSLNSGRARGAKFYPVKTDGDGLVPEDLEAVLSGWDEARQGRKPHLLYTIPCGQNPTGSVQPSERYDAIYRICQKHDVIIMEDDPYFPLQYTAYERDPAARAHKLAAARAEMPPVPRDAADDDAAAVARVFNDYAGVRSYLSRDTDGRVVRIDTFSKVFGPGMRLGWVSANAAFVERLMRIGETSTQVPNNLAQATIASYLSDEHWGLGGWLRWQWGVRLEYQHKRDFFLDKLALYVPAELVSTVPCGGGMFQWLRISVDKHARYTRTPLVPAQSAGSLDVVAATVDTVVAESGPEGAQDETEYTTNTSELIDELWEYLVHEGNVLLMPARLFQVPKPGVDQTEGLNYFRATFAGNLETIDAALAAFGKTIQAWFARG